MDVVAELPPQLSQSGAMDFGGQDTDDEEAFVDSVVPASNSVTGGLTLLPILTTATMQMEIAAARVLSLFWLLARATRDGLLRAAAMTRGT